MKKFRKWLLIALVVEGMTYYWELFQHVESFFFVWGTLYLGLFLIEVFRVDTSRLGLLNYQLLKAKFKYIPNEHSEVEKRDPIAVSTGITVFGVMMIMNVITFLVLMPKE